MNKIEPGFYEVVPQAEHRRISILILPDNQCILRVLTILGPLPEAEMKESFVVGNLESIEGLLYLRDGQRLEKMGNTGFTEVGIIHTRMQNALDSMKAFVGQEVYQARREDVQKKSADLQDDLKKYSF